MLRNNQWLIRREDLSIPSTVQGTKITYAGLNHQHIKHSVVLPCLMGKLTNSDCPSGRKRDPLSNQVLLLVSFSHFCMHVTRNNLRVGHRFVSVAEARLLAERTVGKEKLLHDAIVEGCCYQSLKISRHLRFDKPRF